MGDEWFRFGLVRGLIGFVVALLASAVLMQFGLIGWGCAPITKSMISNMATSPARFDPTVVGIAIIIAGFVAIVGSGAIYWFGAWLCRELHIKAKGLWAPITVAVIGSTVATIIIGVILMIVLTPIAPDLASKTFLAMVASIPIGIIAEIGYVVITYGLYKYVGWPTPEL